MTVQYDLALDLHEGTLYVANVDEIEVEVESDATVGVIS